MKRFIALFLCAAFCLGAAGCSRSPGNDGASSSTSQEQTAPEALLLPLIGENAPEYIIVRGDLAPKEETDAAVFRVAVHQIVIVSRQDQHDRPADAQAQRASDGAGNGQEGAARHDERAPADAAAEGQRPCPEGAQIFLPGFQIRFQLSSYA